MQTRDARDSKQGVVKTLAVDLNRTIRKVSLRIKDVKIVGLRLIDQNEEIILEEIWGACALFGSWHT